MALIEYFAPLTLATALVAQGVPKPALTIEDLTPKFLRFYQTTIQEHADPNRRWELWKQLYGFAAVPPTPQGDQMARKILDNAWPRYESALPVIRRGIGNLQPPPAEILDSVAATLGVDVPIRAKLLLFVGGFDNNAFTSPGTNGIPTVALPVEGTGSVLILTHEFTHVVEAEQAHLSLDWKRSIAHTKTLGRPGNTSRPILEKTPLCRRAFAARVGTCLYSNVNPRATSGALSPQPL